MDKKNIYFPNKRGSTTGLRSKSRVIPVVRMPIIFPILLILTRTFWYQCLFAEWSNYYRRDFDYRFGIESVSKVHTAILILRQYGAQKVLEMIGADATGLPFNSIIAILLKMIIRLLRWSMPEPSLLVPW